MQFRSGVDTSPDLIIRICIFSGKQSVKKPFTLANRSDGSVGPRLVQLCIDPPKSWLSVSKHIIKVFLPFCLRGGRHSCVPLLTIQCSIWLKRRAFKLIDKLSHWCHSWIAKNRQKTSRLLITLEEEYIRIDETQAKATHR